MSDLPVKPLLICNGKSGIEAFITSLPSRISRFTDEQLQTFIREMDILEEALCDVVSPEQEDWIRRIRDILMREWDARWLIQRLIERGVVYMERS